MSGAVLPPMKEVTTASPVIYSVLQIGGCSRLCDIDYPLTAVRIAIILQPFKLVGVAESNSAGELPKPTHDVGCNHYSC